MPATTRPITVSAERVFTVLTAHSWTFGIRDRLPDYHIYRFRADGSYVLEHHTDYTTRPLKGRWNLRQDAGECWLLCLDDGHRLRLTLDDDGTISWGPRLRPDEPQPVEARLTAATLPDFPLPDEVVRIAERLSRHAWRRANDFDLSTQPTLVRFTAGWNYQATYRDGEYTSRGSWYATPRSWHDQRREILATGPDAGGDLRPGRRDDGYGEQLRVDLVDGRDDEILINSDLYIPADALQGKPPARGVTCGFIAFSNIAVRVEYDMPIRRGVKNRFDVTIGCVAQPSGGGGAVTVERVTLTDAYRDYRTPRPGVQPTEIAASCPNGKILHPRESMTRTGAPTLAQAGPQYIYFNVLIAGRTQNYDVHVAREIRVRP